MGLFILLAVISLLQHIDWHRFLVRPAIQSPSRKSLATLGRAPVLVTGAGGSIGSALALRITALGFPTLLLEASEGRLSRLKSTWPAASGPDSPAACVSFILGCASNCELLDEVFAEHAPGVIFHAAAHKHVPLLEEQPLAAVANNIFVTEKLARKAAAHGARVVLLSTDKAVDPVSVLGVTKRVAELIVLAHGGTVLRLGNVLGSSGSVTEVFAQQIMHGGPITLTDARARRYFLTMDEAVNLLLAAAIESWPALLVPLLPSSHSIFDLAAYLSRELAPGRTIPIEHTGLRPGDKVSERLWSTTESIEPSRAKNLAAVRFFRAAQSELQSGLAALQAALDERNAALILDGLCALVPEYRPSPTALGLARKSSSRVCV